MPEWSTIGRVIRGFQAGADQAGARAARARGIATEGPRPGRSLAEGGPRLEFAGPHGAVATQGGSHPDRILANTRDSAGTLRIGSTAGRGYGPADGAAEGSAPGEPLLVAEPSTRPSRLDEWPRARGIKVLDAAGDQKSVPPGIASRPGDPSWRRSGGSPTPRHDRHAPEDEQQHAGHAGRDRDNRYGWLGRALDASPRPGPGPTATP